MLWKLFTDGYKSRDIYLNKREAENIISACTLPCPCLCSSVQAAKCLWSTNCPEWACFAFCSAGSEYPVESLPALAKYLLISAEISFSWHLHSEFFKGFFYVLKVKTKVGREKSSWKHWFSVSWWIEALHKHLRQFYVSGVYFQDRAEWPVPLNSVHSEKKSKGLMSRAGNWDIQLTIKHSNIGSISSLRARV